jgi:hypothetical protein
MTTHKRARSQTETSHSKFQFPPVKGALKHKTVRRCSKLKLKLEIKIKRTLRAVMFVTVAHNELPQLKPKPEYDGLW